MAPFQTINIQLENVLLMLRAFECQLYDPIGNGHFLLYDLDYGIHKRIFNGEPIFSGLDTFQTDDDITAERILTNYKDAIIKPRSRKYQFYGHYLKFCLENLIKEIDFNLSHPRREISYRNYIKSIYNKINGHLGIIKGDLAKFEEDPRHFEILINLCMRNGLQDINEAVPFARKVLNAWEVQTEYLPIFLESDLKTLYEQYFTEPTLKTRKISDYDPKTFKEIFVVPEWKKYVKALQICDPPLISKKMEFIGKGRKHRGVVCSWFRHLQDSKIIKQAINRQILASILNNQIKNFDLGKDGKTFDNVSKEFDNVFKEQLIELTK